MNWYTKIKISARRESMQIDRYTGSITVDYLVNPSKNEIIGLLNRTIGKDARGLLVDGTLYVWDAMMVNHCEFCRNVDGQCDEHLQCYNDDIGEGGGGYGYDAMIFSIGPNGELRTNLSQRDLDTGYFKGKVKPYQSPQDSGDDFDFYTHELV